MTGSVPVPSPAVLPNQRIYSIGARDYLSRRLLARKEQPIIKLASVYAATPKFTEVAHVSMDH